MDLLLRLLNPLIICIILCLYRIAVGPTAADRAVGVDILGIIVVGSCAFLTLVTKKDFFIDIAVAWALQSFIGTIALSKYLEGRHLDD
jgi:multicomponent Na+:H+ antiporter subunit F